MRRETGKTYREMLKRMAEESGIRDAVGRRSGNFSRPSSSLASCSYRKRPASIPSMTPEDVRVLVAHQMSASAVVEAPVGCGGAIGGPQIHRRGRRAELSDLLSFMSVGSGAAIGAGFGERRSSVGNAPGTTVRGRWRGDGGGPGAG